MGGWIAFWDSEHAIYVNARHRDVHYRVIAEDIARYIHSGAHVLDYGCGEALHAEIPAAAASELILCEAAPKVRASLATRFAGNSKIKVMAPEQVSALPDQSLDLIVMHSVAQYITKAEMKELLVLFRRLLKPDGQLVLGDIIPMHVLALTDALALLRLARREGFFFAACFGLLRTLMSNYWDLRTELGLTRYDKDEILAMLIREKFWATNAQANLGHNQARVTYLGRPIKKTAPSPFA
jgi:SAM-dependent methyltransferase